MWFGVSGPRNIISLFERFAERNIDQEIDEGSIVPVDLDVRFLMARNTLWMVIVLFAVYLVYEVSSMWFRSFPKGFYYAGYAHQGAFWLTVALALSTILLSIIFCRSMLRDARLKNLRKLAWIWSFENWVLAIAAFYRLAIYIDFNGMTRMRVIGILGVGTVVMGFGLVVYKIIYTRSFAWLIQGQLWALAAAFVLHAILPVDWLVHAHNGREVHRGHWSPSVQTIAHPMRPDGMLPLISLVDCDDVEIREGVRAMAADWRERLARNRNWTEFQLAEKLLMSELDRIDSSSLLTEIGTCARRGLSGSASMLTSGIEYGFPNLEELDGRPGGCECNPSRRCP